MGRRSNLSGGFELDPLAQVAERTRLLDAGQPEVQARVAEPAKAPPRAVAAPPSRETAASQLATRKGTAHNPYQRTDGVAVASTSITLPVEQLTELRVAAAVRSVSASSIVSQALEEWFERQK